MTNQFLSILLLSAGWIKFFQFFIALSILILLHEWGHYYAARRTGTRVEKFYLFFDFLFPVSTWLPFSLFKKKVGDTEYGIGWFPMGGYVKIAGMIDESMDKEQMALPPQPWEFRSKPAWQRLIIMLGGVTVNFILAFIIYIGMTFTYGDFYINNSEVKDGVWVSNPVVEQIGIKTGDKIIAVDGVKIDKFDQINEKILFKREHNKVQVSLAPTRQHQRVEILFETRRTQRRQFALQLLLLLLLPLTLLDHLVVYLLIHN
jgi:regulator of sigma E protease